jgi:large subunit ribosomal protein L17
MSYLQNKESVTALFGEVAGRTADRPGGYTRIIKLGDVRLGDAAEMCLLELVDFNDLYKKDGAEKKAKTRRGRKGKKAEEEAGAIAVAETEAKTEEKPKKAAKKTSKKKE